MDKGSFEDVNWGEFFTAISISLGVGMLRFLMKVRRARKIRWIDAIIEPGIAVLAGLMMWGLAEVTQVPDVLQAVLTSLGAWGGNRTLHRMERKYLGGSRASDFTDLD